MLFREAPISGHVFRRNQLAGRFLADHQAMLTEFGDTEE